MAPSAAPATILIAEDNASLTSLLERILGDQGYEVRAARDGDAALAAALEHEPDLLILDIGLPRRDGVAVIRELRRRGVTVPTLMLTARSAISDRVTGLDAGADDYLTKPFDPDELVARVRALLRRSAAQRRPQRLCVADVVLDPMTREVYRGERKLGLTQREFSLLEFFMRNVGESLSREAIAREVWRHMSVDPEATNVVDVYVAYLRKKLDGPGDEPLLHTVRGVGYVMRPRLKTRE